jgi:hypothetical protein
MKLMIQSLKTIKMNLGKISQLMTKYNQTYFQIIKISKISNYKILLFFIILKFVQF